MFPINVQYLWDFGAWGPRHAPDQGVGPEAQVGMADGRALMAGTCSLAPPALLPSCSLHLHRGPLD